MGLLVFGASGRTGRRVLATARAQGVQVRAFVRDRASVDASIDTHVGDVTRLEHVAAAVRPHDVVISALGGDRSAKPGHAMSVGIANIVAAMRAVSATRVVAVAGAGVLQADVARKLHELPSYPSRFRAVGAEHQGMLAALEASPLAWLLVCTPDLVDGDAAGGSREWSTWCAQKATRCLAKRASRRRKKRDGSADRAARPVDIPSVGRPRLPSREL